MRTFSSSSFFSERCFRLRAVSSRLSAISASFSCFFLRDVSSMLPPDDLVRNQDEPYPVNEGTHLAKRATTRRRSPARLGALSAAFSRRRREAGRRRRPQTRCRCRGLCPCGRRGGREPASGFEWGA
jgi:hypothetical protein